MNTIKISIFRKRTYDAIASALLGWIMYIVKQDWTPNAIIGTFAEVFYKLYIYFIMSFAFAGLLLAITAYTVKRFRRLYDCDPLFVLLSIVALALSFYVTVPVIGEIGIVTATVTFFVLRLIRLL